MGNKMKKNIIALILIALFATPALAMNSEVRISKQYGLPYLPLMVVEEHKLIEKQAAAVGLNNVKVTWLTFGSGATSNDALLSGNVDIISGGVAPFLRLWDKSKGKVKALASLDQSPQVLNTSRPEVKSLKDFTPNDKIALPAVKVSMQALALQMAAAKEFGKENYDKIDYLTVSAKYPDAAIALTSGKSEITGHVASEPFSTFELNSPGIHSVFSSYDVLGGHHISNLISTSESFYNSNKELCKAILLALDNASAWIADNKVKAAELYITKTNSKEPVELITEILKNPDIVYSTVPVRITMFSDFLYDQGAIKTKAHSWKDLYFDAIFDRVGS